MATVDPPSTAGLFDITNVPDEFKATTYQQTLANAGINPAVYSRLVRALVQDYGFKPSIAVAILSEAINKLTYQATEEYFSKLLFTIGRKVGYTYNTALPENRIRDLVFVKSVPHFASAVKQPPIAPAANMHIPYGAVRFDENNINNILSVYDDAVDANLLLESSDNVQNNVGIYESGIKIIVSNRRQEDYSSNSSDIIFKKVKNSAQVEIQRLFGMETPSTERGMYNVPEWTPLMLTRREMRVKHMVHKLLRNWRAVSVSAKRRSLWEAGYVNADRDAMGVMQPVDLLNLAHLPNWVREEAVKYYDSEILNPIYQEIISRLESVIHTNYPVTQDEIAHYMLDLFDMIWNDANKDSTKNVYFKQLYALLGCYALPNAFKHAEMWMRINRILDPTIQAPVVRPVENLIELFTSVKAGIASAPEQVKDKMKQIMNIVDVMQNGSVNQIVPTYKDSDFNNALYSYLNARVQKRELEKIAELPEEPPVKELIVSLIVGMILSNANDLDNGDLRRWNRVAEDSIGQYPKDYDILMQTILPRELVLRRLRADQVNALTAMTPANMMLQQLDAEITALNRRHAASGNQLTLETVLTNDGGRAANAGWGLITASVLKHFAPMTMNPVIDYTHLDGIIDSAETALNIFFSNQQINAGGLAFGRDPTKSLQPYAQEEKELVDMMLQLDGLHLDKKSSQSVINGLKGKHKVILNHNRFVRVEIEPTVEYTMIVTPKYRYTVHLMTAEEHKYSSDINDRGTLVTSITNEKPSIIIPVSIPEGKSAMVFCKVEALLTNGNVIAVGDMPPLTVERIKTCRRTGTKYSDFEIGARPIRRIDFSWQPRPYDTVNSARKAKWSAEVSQELLNSKWEKFNEINASLRDVKDLFRFFYTAHLTEAMDPNAPGILNYRHFWYNANNLDKEEALRAVVHVVSDPYKEIMIQGRLDMKAEAEMNARKTKKTLKIYKQLFMFEEYNSYLERNANELGSIDIIQRSNTLDKATFQHPVIDQLYKNKIGSDFAAEQVFSQVPYLSVLNFMLNVATMLKNRQMERASLFLPDRMLLSTTTAFYIDFAGRCVREILGRVNLLIAGLSFNKSKSDRDPDVSMVETFPLETFLTASLTKFIEKKDMIPDNLPVFEYNKDLSELGPGIEMAPIKDLTLLTCAKSAQKSIESEYYAASQFGNVGGRSLTAREYIGYYSDDNDFPYFFELTTDDGRRLTRLPMDRFGAFTAATTNGFALRYGDKLSNMSEESTEKIVDLFDKFVATIDVTARTASPDLLHQLILACKEHNNLLM